MNSSQEYHFACYCVPAIFIVTIIPATIRLLHYVYSPFTPSYEKIDIKQV